MTIIILGISLILILLASKYISILFEKIQLPGLIGIMLLGMLLGPNILNIVPEVTIQSAPFIKDTALVIVLFIAGLGIKVEQMKKIGRPALLLSIIPALFEGITIMILAVQLLDFTYIQGGVLGFIIAAVSPAVLIPSMLKLIQDRYGSDKSIPEMLMVGASADDTVAITCFTMFLNLQIALTAGRTINFWQYLILIPIIIIFAIICGWMLAKITNLWLRYVHLPKALQIGSVCVLVLGIRYLENWLHLEWFNSLLIIMVFGFFLLNTNESFATDVKNQLNRFWKYGKNFLFFFVGMVLNPGLIGQYGILALGLLAISLTIRSIGVLLSLIGTNLTWAERLFCVVAYLPKATVQSAKSGVPLQYGIAGAEVMQAIAIMSVLITAPIGAIGIKVLAPICLQKESE